jgi:hypothetical protein
MVQARASKPQRAVVEKALTTNLPLDPLDAFVAFEESRGWSTSASARG